MGLFRRRPKYRPSVEVTDEGVRRVVPDGTVEWVAWDELTGVDVMTTVAGPLGEDVFFVLLGENENGCVVSAAARACGLPRRAA